MAPVEGRAAGGGTAVQASGTAGTPGSGDDETGKGSSAGTPATDDHSDTAWRLRHQRRGVLREVELPSEFLDDLGEPGGAETVAVLFGRAMTSPARAATSFFADAPLSGQVNFLTTNLFDGPDQLTSAAPARGIAYVKLGAPVGDHADWTVRGALTEGDLAAWIVAGMHHVVLHTIGRTDGPGATNPWIAKYIFPGSTRAAMNAMTMTPPQFAAHIKAETERMTRIIQLSGARVD